MLPRMRSSPAAVLHAHTGWDEVDIFQWKYRTRLWRLQLLENLPFPILTSIPYLKEKAAWLRNVWKVEHALNNS